MKIFIISIFYSTLLCAFALAVLAPTLLLWSAENVYVVVVHFQAADQFPLTPCWENMAIMAHTLWLLFEIRESFFQQIIVDAGMSKTFCIIVVAVFSVFFFLSIPFNCSWLATHLCILFVNKILRSYRRPADVKVFNSINFN